MPLNQTILDQLSTTILSEYNTGRIVSERHLQAFIYHQLHEQMQEAGLTLVIEPSIKTMEKSNIDGLIPDVIIRSEKEVLAVIELKFVPYGYPQYKKDFATFSAFYSSVDKQSKIYLSCSPKDGLWDQEKRYTLSTDLKVYYLVIARHDSYLFSDTSSIVNEYFDAFNTYFFQPIFIKIDPSSDPQKTIVQTDQIYVK
jgi:hypothetical protein